MLKTKWFRGVVIGLASAIVGAALLLTGVLEGLEDTTFDIRARALARTSDATDDVVLILVDQYSIDTLIETNSVSWPWPRSVHSYVVEFCRLADVASLTYDLILQDQGVAGPTDDNALLFAAEDLARFAYAVELNKAPDNPNRWPDHVRKPPIEYSGLETLKEEVREEMQFDRGVFPHFDVTAPSAWIGFVNGDNDDDGVFRHYRLLNFHRGEPVPSLALAAYASAQDGPVTIAFDRSTVSLNGTRFPIDADGDILLSFNTPGDLDYVSDPTVPVPMHTAYRAWDIIESVIQLSMGEEPTVEPADLEGKYVLLGLSASGLFDLRPTPVDPRAPGVTVHATMLDNLLSGEVMRSFPDWATFVVLILLTVAAALAATYASKTWVEALLIVGFLAVPLGLGFGGYALGFWVPMVVILVAVFVALAAANVANYATEGAQKRFIRGAFSQYLSPAVIGQLEQDPERLKLGGERRDLTMYFSDVEGFTSISERLDPEQLTGLINGYLTPMTDIIIQEEAGTIDKYEGDAIIAFWNAPMDQPDHAIRGVRAALKCQQRLRELNPEFSQIAGTDMKMRIGLNTGPAVVGNMGSNTRFDYTMLGDSVNLAARLESANKQFGTYTMISRNTLDQLDAGGEDRELGFVGILNDIAVRELGRLQVKGKLEPVTVFEVMTPQELAARRGVVDTFCAALRLYYNARFAEALEAFTSIKEADPAAAKYAQACGPLISQPPKMWDGRMTLEAK